MTTNRCTFTHLNLNPLWKPCRGNSLYPSTLFRELSRQSLYILNPNSLLEVKPNKPLRFCIESFSRIKQVKPIRSHTNSLLVIKPDTPVHSHRKSPFSKATPDEPVHFHEPSC